MNKFYKSPIHYMGGKFDLLPHLIEQFPKKEEVSIFYDVFGGGANVSMNVPYNRIIYNELNYNIVNLLKMLRDNKPDIIHNHILKRIEEFDLNTIGTDYRSGIEKDKIDYYNKSYLKFRDFYNKSNPRNVMDLYTLTFYSFCNLMRFNNNNEFNMPYGNRCYLLEEDKNRIEEAHKLLQKIEINLGDAFELLKRITKNENQFIYIDPPYINSTAIYNENRAENKGWTLDDDERLFVELDRLTSLGIKWAYSNVLEIRGKSNNHIEEWANKNGYTIIDFEDKVYSSLGKGNANAREVLIINYEQRVKKYSIFDFGIEM